MSTKIESLDEFLGEVHPDIPILNQSVNDEIAKLAEYELVFEDYEGRKYEAKTGFKFDHTSKQIIVSID